MSSTRHQIGQYTIVETLRRNGAARVYLAERDGRRYAIKTFPCMALVDDETRARFRREVTIHTNLQHPNICKVEDFGSWNDGTPFIVMEHLDGETMEALLKREAPLPLPRVVDLLGQTLRGLQPIHDQGIIHRGLLPANLLITKEGVVKILDFGLARKYGSPQVTPAGVSLGNLAFVAPEQIFDAHSVDTRADLFTVGSIAYWMLAGRLPFSSDGQSKAQLMDRIAGAGYASLSAVRPDLPASWSAWLGRMLEPTPEKRFASASEAAAALPGYK